MARPGWEKPVRWRMDTSCISNAFFVSIIIASSLYGVTLVGGGGGGGGGGDSSGKIHNILQVLILYYTTRQWQYNLAITGIMVECSCNKV